MYKIVMEIPKGWGVILVVKKWKFRGGGGGLHEIPSVVGVWIFSGTTHYIKQIDSMLPWVCSVIDQKRRQNVIRTSVTLSATPRGPLLSNTTF